MTMELIYHLATPDDANALAQNQPYTCQSLESEGFIHCCTADQLAGVLQRYYKNADQLTLLSVDPAALGDTLVYENTVGGEELFPHQYGKIAHSAVFRSQRLLRDAIQRLMNGQHPSTLE